MQNTQKIIHQISYEHVLGSDSKKQGLVFHNEFEIFFFKKTNS